jgi:transposase
MSLKCRQFRRECKQQVLREIEAGKSLAQAAREHQVHPNCISEWKRQLARYGENAFAGKGNPYKDEAKIAELERLIGQQAVEIAFLKRALTHLETHQTDKATGGNRGAPSCMATRRP